jgi:histidyl-tRNA synthetase
MESFIEVIKILDRLLKKILKNKFIYIFTDPKIHNKSNFVFNSKNPTNKINVFINAFNKAVKSPYKINLEKNFFSKDYHQDIFFYVYSDKSKKILARGGGYHYKKSNKKIDGFGFSCNVDNLVEII